MIKYLPVWLLCGLPALLTAQNNFSLEDAITTALKNNFDIQIAFLEQQADSMQVYRSNAGFGPVIDLNAGASLQGNNVDQTFLDGRNVNRWGRSYGPNANVSLGMVLFDGGRRQALFDQLGLLSEQSVLQAKVIIQNVVAQITTTYYEIERQQKTVEYLNNVIGYYQERLKITEERWKLGRGSKIDFLQSQTDLNAQLSELTRVKNSLQNAKVLLNGLLNRPPATNFNIEITDQPPASYDFNQLSQQALDKNKELVVLTKTIEINQQQESILAADQKPQISLNSAAGFTYNNSNTGFLQSSRNLFGNINIAARWNIFDGHNRQKQLDIAKLNTLISQKQFRQLEQQIINELTLLYNQYQSDKELLQLEISNKEIAEENLSISLEKFRLGASTILELNEAQRTYDIALNRLVNAEFNVKISAVELLRLAGLLVK